MCLESVQGIELAYTLCLEEGRNTTCHIRTLSGSRSTPVVPQQTQDQGMDKKGSICVAITLLGVCAAVIMNVPPAAFSWNSPAGQAKQIYCDSNEMELN
jgi:hypothetical protein